MRHNIKRLKRLIGYPVKIEWLDTCFHSRNTLPLEILSKYITKDNSLLLCIEYGEVIQVNKDIISIANHLGENGKVDYTSIPLPMIENIIRLK